MPVGLRPVAKVTSERTDSLRSAILTIFWGLQAVYLGTDLRPRAIGEISFTRCFISSRSSVSAEFNSAMLGV